MMPSNNKKLNVSLFKSFFRLGFLYLPFHGLSSCKPKDSTDEVATRLSTEPKESELNGKIAIRVNTNTNYLFLYKEGKPVVRWMVATGDHKKSKNTPTGVFTVHEKEECPTWNNGKGTVQARCAETNPLGKKSLWFDKGKLYGLHGVNTKPYRTKHDNVEHPSGIPSIRETIAEKRSVSSGCVRNPPENLEFLFQKVPLHTKIVIGKFDIDPKDVPDCSQQQSVCENHWKGEKIPEAPAETNPEKKEGSSNPSQNKTFSSVPPAKMPSWCGLAPGGSQVKTMPGQGELVDALNGQARVRVENVTEGLAVEGNRKWYSVSYILNQTNKTGFIHESFLNCSP